ERVRGRCLRARDHRRFRAPGARARAPRGRQPLEPDAAPAVRGAAPLAPAAGGARARAERLRTMPLAALFRLEGLARAHDPRAPLRFVFPSEPACGAL